METGMNWPWALLGWTAFYFAGFGVNFIATAVWGGAIGYQIGRGRQRQAAITFTGGVVLFLGIVSLLWVAPHSGFITGGPKG